MNVETIVTQAQAQMNKSLEALKNELAKLRTGRAHTSLLEHVMVDMYGTQTPLYQVASISVENARTLTVTAWDKGKIPAIEKAILTADLGLNPATAGQVIRVPLPALTEERRKEMVKIVKEEGERAKVSVRNARRDANNHAKQSQKDKLISEDDEKRLEQRIQKITDETIAKIDKVVADKEKDLMEV